MVRAAYERMAQVGGHLRGLLDEPERVNLLALCVFAAQTVASTLVVNYGWLSADNAQTWHTSCALMGQTRFRYAYSLAWFVPAILACSMIKHAVLLYVYGTGAATATGGFDAGYARHARALEYTFSAGLMLVVVAATTGVEDIGVLVTLFALNAVTQTADLAVKEAGGTGSECGTYLAALSCLSFAQAWALIWYYFGVAVQTAKGDGVPGFVYAIVGSIFLLFCVFIVVDWNVDSPARKSVAMDVASVAAKTTLAWILLGGATRPEQQAGGGGGGGGG